jgi:hypothetical protein
MDSRAQRAPWDSETIIELLSRVTNGFESPTSPLESEINNELLSRVTHLVDSANTQETNKTATNCYHG